LGAGVVEMPSPVWSGTILRQVNGGWWLLCVNAGKYTDFNLNELNNYAVQKFVLPFFF